MTGCRQLKDFAQNDKEKTKTEKMLGNVGPSNHASDGGASP